MIELITLSKSRKEGGAVAIVVAIVIFLLLGFGALSLDIAHLCVAQGELRNASDAGALAGALFLYNDDGTLVNEGANQIAYDAATENKSEKVAVEVNEGDIERGHWSFGLGTLGRGFTANSSTEPVALWNVSTVELDQDPDFINAVRVMTRREAVPILSFFARIFGFESFQASAESVAYIGFAGTLAPYDVDQPIAICRESILTDGGEGEDPIYTCTDGRMINSGTNCDTHQTGGWTSYSQDDACLGGTNASEVNPLVCNGVGNENPMILGDDIATQGGMATSVYTTLRNCWLVESNNGTDPWLLTLPVVDCDGNNVLTCEELVGAVSVNILFISESGNPNSHTMWPTVMSGVAGYPDWVTPNPENSDQGRIDSWNSFRDNFHLKGLDDECVEVAADLMGATIYFLPDCTPHLPAGVTGGENFGVLAKIPVLVK